MSFLKLYSPPEIRRQIAKRARAIRVSRMQTQADLASAAGVGLSTISRFERGDDVAFSVVIAVSLALGTEDSLLAAFPESERRSFDELVNKKPQALRVRRRSK